MFTIKRALNLKAPFPVLLQIIHVSSTKLLHTSEHNLSVCNRRKAALSPLSWVLGD